MPLHVFMQPLPHVFVHPSVHPLAQAIVHVESHVPVQSVQKVCPLFVPEHIVVQKPVQRPLHPVEVLVPASKFEIELSISSYFINFPSL